MDELLDSYKVFDSVNHLKPNFDKVQFDSLHSWDFGWAILEPIDISGVDLTEQELSKRFSPGQKLLYFFWYLDAQVTNGGFIQFYFNGYRKYLPTIVTGLQLVGDDKMEKLISTVEKFFIKNENQFDLLIKKNDIISAYKQFEVSSFDETYLEIHGNTMELIENYARENADQFVQFTE